MKSLLTTLSIVTIIVIVAISSMGSKPTRVTDSSKGINFHSGTWQEALDLAKKENKLIFLDVYASWCGPCKKLKSHTFSDAEVAKYYNSKFINVSADAEKGEGIQLANMYSVHQYPTLLFVNQDGKIVHSTAGYHNSKQFLKLGQSIKQTNAD
ncbi:MAG: thioredoxin family protein [Bacteroidia bacterium]